MSKARFSLVVLFLAVVMLFVSCSNDAPNHNGGDSYGEGKGAFILSLSGLSESDVRNMQEIVIRDNGEIIRTLYADDIVFAIKPSDSSRDVVKDYDILVELDDGTYNITAQGSGKEGVGFVLDETRISIETGAKPISYPCTMVNSSIMYVDFRAYLPIWFGEYFMSVSLTDGDSDLNLNLRYTESSFKIPSYFKENITVHASLSSALEALGYFLEYDANITFRSEESKCYPIVLRNSNFENPSKGNAVEVTFQLEDSYFQFFRSFWTENFMEEYLDDYNNNFSERREHTYVLPFSILPAEGRVTIYEPKGLTYLNASSGVDSANSCGERVNFDKDGNAWTISTSSKIGQTAWMHVSLPEFPQDLLDALDRVDFFYGEDSIGGWGSGPASTNLNHPYTYTISMTPGTFSVEGRIRYKSGENATYRLVPSTEILTTRAGYIYDLSFTLERI